MADTELPPQRRIVQFLTQPSTFTCHKDFSIHSAGMSTAVDTEWLLSTLFLTPPCIT
jgi:hypothetical protein